MQWEEKINIFLKLAYKNNIRMLMVGGGAVNFHGYQRHSANVDFWIETTLENLNKLIIVFNEMGCDITDFPEEVYKQEQNISVKFSPVDLDLELITRFSINKSFNQAYKESEEVKVKGQEFLRWQFLSLDDLIDSKVKSGRTKDLLDIQQLQKIKSSKK